jgi:hypothetical protein
MQEARREKPCLTCSPSEQALGIRNQHCKSQSEKNKIKEKVKSSLKQGKKKTKGKSRPV